jgi:hypothetical protein
MAKGGGNLQKIYKKALFRISTNFNGNFAALGNY